MHCSRDTLFQSSLFQRCTASEIHCFKDTLFQRCIVLEMRCFRDALFQKCIVSEMYCFRDALFQSCIISVMHHFKDKYIFQKCSISETRFSSRKIWFYVETHKLNFAILWILLHENNNNWRTYMIFDQIWLPFHEHLWNSVDRFHSLTEYLIRFKNWIELKNVNFICIKKTLFHLFGANLVNPVYILISVWANQ